MRDSDFEEFCKTYFYCFNLVNVCFCVCVYTCELRYPQRLNVLDLYGGGITCVCELPNMDIGN